MCRALSNPGKKGSTCVRAGIHIVGVLGGVRGGSLQAAPGLGGQEVCLSWGWLRAGSLWVPLRTHPQLSLTATPAPPPAQSIIRVVFHDRRLQYTEHQQLEGWRWSRPGDRILDIGESPGPGGRGRRSSRHTGVLPGCLPDPGLSRASWRTFALCETPQELVEVTVPPGLPSGVHLLWGPGMGWHAGFKDLPSGSEKQGKLCRKTLP